MQHRKEEEIHSQVRLDPRVRCQHQSQRPQLQGRRSAQIQSQRGPPENERLRMKDKTNREEMRSLGYCHRQRCQQKR